MAKEAERMLADTGWLPEPLRLKHVDDEAPAANDEAAAEIEALPEFLAGHGEEIPVERDAPHPIAAE